VLRPQVVERAVALTVEALQRQTDGSDVVRLQAHLDELDRELTNLAETWLPASSPCDGSRNGVGSPLPGETHRCCFSGTLVDVVMPGMKAAQCVLLVALTTTAAGQRFDSAAALKQAEREVPSLVGVLELKPGMTVADVGAGFGAWAVTLARWIGPSGRVYATEIGAEQLTAIREAVARERLDNVVVLEGAAGSANLPDGCCDAVFLRDVYHHLTQPEAFDRSIVSALKHGGRLAIIDFEPEPGSKTPAGVLANRGGHGILPSLIVSELSAAGLSHAQTLKIWPPDSAGVRPYFLVLFRKG
jgi:precorrin-6B methylase 2